MKINKKRRKIVQKKDRIYEQKVIISFIGFICFDILLLLSHLWLL